MSIFFTICIMYVEFSFCLGTMIGWREIGCANTYAIPKWLMNKTLFSPIASPSTTLAELGAPSKVNSTFLIHSVCSFSLNTRWLNNSGMMFVYFTLASVLWWLVMAFNLFLLVVVGIPMRALSWVLWFKQLKNGKAFLRLETLYIGYHLFCWLPPIITLIIAVSNEKLGYDQDLWYLYLPFYPRLYKRK